VGFLPGMITGLVMGLLMDGLFSPGLGPWMLIYLAVAWIFIRIRESDWEVEKIYLTLIMGGITVLSYGMMTFFLFFYGYQYSFLREVLPFMIGEAIANMGFWIAVLWLFPKIIREAGKDYMSTLQ
jgi:rod shape-determining protein MreD